MLKLVFWPGPSSSCMDPKPAKRDSPILFRLQMKIRKTSGVFSVYHFKILRVFLPTYLSAIDRKQ